MRNLGNYGEVIMSAGNMAGNLSVVQQVVNAISYSVQASWTGSGSAGTLKLQASNDNVVWDDIVGSSEVVSGAGSFMWNVTSIGYNFVKIVFTASGGSSGSLQINVNYKGF